MNVSYNWLCEIIPGLAKIPARELANRLTMSGLEVEEFIDQGAKWKGIVVGEVVARDKHPNADKLSLCKVRTATEEFQVVCGAPNVTAGKKYPFATLGTVMPGGLEIKPIKLRGVESFGMLCSAKELELTSDHVGLHELAADLETGADLAKALGRSDVIFGLNVTPNRGDALSHWGVARDIAALTGLNPDLKTIFPVASGLQSGLSEARPHASQRGELKITLDDAIGCPRYSASQISGVKVAPSPRWLAERLESLGLRSINNVVDATNYVMLLTGHPVHAFDAATVAGSQIRIYSLTEPQSFKTLDGVERELKSGDVVIADRDRVVALAGIMGGENSGVTDKTTNLILEVAFFAPEAIRKTSRRLGLQTDSSYRFARFVNPDSIILAHTILSDLILALAGGEAGAVLDFYPKPYKPHTIRLVERDITRWLGITVPAERVVAILTGLACTVKAEQGGYLVTVPSARSDLERPVDLIEEIARIHGMENIPASLPRLVVHSSVESPALLRESEIKTFFVDRGFCETVHYSFGDATTFEKILRRPAQEMVRLKNPLSEDLAVMRPSLLPQLLACYKKNHLNTDKGLRLFELRKVYSQNATSQTTERRVLAALYAGNPWGRNPFGLTRASDFNDGKGLLAAFFAQARLEVAEKVYTDWPYHSGQSAAFLFRGKMVAMVGTLHPELLQSLKIKDKLYYFELDYENIVQHYKQPVPSYREIASLPPVYRDMALLVPKELTHDMILRAIEKEKSAELVHVELFDLYEGENLPAGKKSLAYSFVYQPHQVSLTDEAVNAMHFSLVEKLKSKLGVELR